MLFRVMAFKYFIVVLIQILVASSTIHNITTIITYQNELQNSITSLLDVEMMDHSDRRRLSLSTDLVVGENVKTINGHVPRVTCPKGYYRPASSNDLVLLTGPRTDGCLPCPTGRYGSTTGLILPLCTSACPLGTYSDMTALTSSTDCKPCPVGRYGSKAGLVTQSCSSKCPAGKYTTTVGNKYLSDCLTCPTGYRGWQCTWALQPRSGQIQDHFRGGDFGYTTKVDPLQQ